MPQEILYMMHKIPQSGFCTECGFKVEDFTDLIECPNCNSTSPPCLDKNQVNININWHELRILTIWAENWGHRKYNGAGIIYAISQRIQDQHPEMGTLTLAEEIQNLPQKIGTTIITDHPGVETNKDGEVT